MSTFAACRQEPVAVWPGAPYPLGATWDGHGTNFSVFSEHAERMELCLIDEHGGETRVDLPERTGPWWHGYVPRVGPGQRYGFRAHGPYEPRSGHRFDAAKFLTDPYARALEGDLVRDEAIDGPPFVAHSLVVDPAFDWRGDRPPRIPWHETVIYECHVKGMTARHPGVAPEQRGTYAGLTAPAVLQHLQALGVTAVELLPVHHFVTDGPLAGRGLRNYWGYNPLGFFAPHAGYRRGGRPGGQVSEFKEMVRTLHDAGLEVILDVVYNHTCEGNHLGPTLSWRGLDNASYYRLAEGDPSFYVDYTGTGNTLNLRHPAVLQLVMDSLRYWVVDMHVDGFRFDLASALARGLHDVDRLSAFFDVIQQDPVVSQVKLIAEPWDLGDGGYQVGNFPVLWSEWNGRYRDTMRDFWRGALPALSDFGYRLCGSSDLYADDGRTPFASVNFVTAHDGFTLADLVSYDQKHNEANGEGNRDGTDDNRSWNSGVEGPTTDPAIVDLRARRQRSFLATLFLSHGVPMLLAGDEMGRTQHGNNNAYCQDNELSWLDWDPDAPKEALLAFTRQLARLRSEHPVLRRRRFFQGRPICGTDVNDVVWLDAAGREMTVDEWEARESHTIAVFLRGDLIAPCGPCGEGIRDDSFLIVFNAHTEPVTFCLPFPPLPGHWTCILDTAEPDPGAISTFRARDPLVVAAHSVRVLLHDLHPDDDGR